MKPFEHLRRAPWQLPFVVGRVHGPTAYMKILLATRRVPNLSLEPETVPSVKLERNLEPEDLVP